MENKWKENSFSKKRKNKRDGMIFRFFLLSILLWTSILFSHILEHKFSVNAMASEFSEEIQNGDWSYKLDENDNAIITGYRGNDTEFTLDTIDGKKIIAIGKAAFSYSQFTKVTISEGIQRIEEDAFYGCQNLEEVTLPDSLTSLGNHAFDWCQNLKSIELPKNLQTIGEAVFADCYINYIGLAEDNPYFVKEKGIIYDSDYKKVFFCSKSEIPRRIILPDSVEEICGYSFYYCDELLSIHLPDGLKEIGENSFYWCSSLEEILLPENIKKIGDRAFGSCHSITRMVLPQSIEEIGSGILMDTAGVKEVEIKAPLEDLKGICSGCYSLEKIQLPEGLKVLNGFWNCGALKELNIPESVEVIEEGAFMNNALTTIFIPANVVEIQEGAFLEMMNLESIEVAAENENYYAQNGMLFSKDYVLLASTNQKTGEVEIPDGCIKIGKKVFYGRDDITKVSATDTLKEVGDEVFAGCTALSEIELGNNITKIGQGSFFATEFYNKTENWENGICYLDSYALYADRECEIMQIREGCKLLADGFCSTNDNLKTVILPQSMQYIGNMAFWLCGNLQNVIGGSQIRRIGEQAFLNNFSLKNIYLQGKEISIADHAFMECRSLENVVIDAEKLKMGENCFGGDYNIKKMVLPRLTKSIQNILEASYVYEGRWMELVLTNVDSTDLSETADTLFQGCGGMDIYVNVLSENFDGVQGKWLEKNNVYFQDEYYNCKFILDNHLLEWDVVKAGETVVSPVALEEYYAVTEEGPVYSNISWDLDGDGFADTLPAQAHEHINAKAIYQVLEQVHSWSIKTVLQEGNCIQNGIIEYMCSVCKAEKIEETVALGHIFSEEWIIEEATTCTGAGIKSQHCIREGCEEKKNVVPILPKGHTWDDGVVVVEPIVGAEGSKVYTCMDCGERKEESIEALPILTGNPSPSQEPTEIPGSSPKPTEIADLSPEPAETPDVSLVPPERPSSSPVSTESPSSLPKATSDLEPNVSPLGTVTDAPEPTDTVTAIPSEISNDILSVKLSVNKKYKVILRWNEVSNAISYEIYRSEQKNKGYKKIKRLNGTKLKYKDKTVLVGKKYYYRIDVLMTETKTSSDIYNIRVPLYQPPTVTLAKKKSGQNIKYIQIRIKKYVGTYVEIQYRKGSGQFHQIALRSNHIGKMKGRFQVQYLSGGDMLSIRVRTYTFKKKRKQYSKWSKVKKVII